MLIRQEEIGKILHNRMMQNIMWKRNDVIYDVT